MSRTGRYSLFDEGLVLKQRADGRQRLKWIKEQQEPDKSEPMGLSAESIHVAASFESHIFGDQVREIR